MRKCPSIESSQFLCDREAEYQLEGTVWCNFHARRKQEPLPRTFDRDYVTARDKAKEEVRSD